MFTLLAMSAGEITGIIIACVVVLALIAVIFGVLPVRIWFRALVSGVKVPMARLIGMKWRGVKVATIVDAYISASKAGLNVTIDELETHVLAKGDAIKVVNALISAHSANIKLEPETARAIDLAGRDVLNAVKVSVNPKVIETPPISAIAKDGIELRVKARVTVRANITRLIGGRASSRPSVRRRATKTCSKTPIRSPRPSSTRGLTTAPRSRSCPSTSPTST